MVVIEMLMMVVIIMNIISIFWGVEEGKATCITCRNYDDGDLAWRKIRRHVSPRAILSLSPLDKLTLQKMFSLFSTATMKQCFIE